MTMPPANTENLAAEYWTDAFAACTTYLIDGAQQEAAFIPCASRWMAAGLVAYDRDYHLLARWVEGIAELTQSELHEDGWRALRAEPAEGERLALLLAEIANDLRGAANRNPQSFGSLTGAAALADAASTAIRGRMGGPPSTGAGPPGHARGVVKLPGAHDYSVADVCTLTGKDTEMAPRTARGLRAYLPSAPMLDRALAAVLHDRTFEDRDPEHHVVRHFCIARTMAAIGDVDSGSGGRSIELAAFVAAISHHWSWRLAHDRIAFTGQLGEAEPLSPTTVQPVADVPAKAAAVAKWARGFPPGGPRPRFYYPRSNERELIAHPEVVEELAAAGIDAIPVASTADVIRSLPFLIPERPTGLRRFVTVIALITWLWYSERLFGGEWWGDPATRSLHAWGTYLALSALPAMIPACVPFFLPLLARRTTRMGIAWLWAVLGQAAASHAMLAIQWLAGGFHFPASTPHMFRAAQDVRIFNVWKDVAVFYPLLLGVFGYFILLASMARWVSAREIASGMFDPFRVQNRVAWARQSRSLRRYGPVLLVALVSLAVWLFREDLYVALTQKRNWPLAIHVVLQIAGMTVLGLVVQLLVVDGASAESGSTRVRANDE
jgi:hypothetical protein